MVYTIIFTTTSHPDYTASTALYSSPTPAAYSYNYKSDPPAGEEVLTKFENRSALAQDLNLLSGMLLII